MTEGTLLSNLPAPELKKRNDEIFPSGELLYLEVPERVGKNFCRVFRLKKNPVPISYPADAPSSLSTGVHAIAALGIIGLCGVLVGKKQN